MGTTRDCMRAYLEALATDGDYGQYFADDVTFSMPDVGIELHGRDEALAAINDWHKNVFDARIEVGDLLVDGDKAAVPLVFDATHMKDFMGIPPAGKKVRAPYSAFYDVRDGMITEVRIFGVVPTILMQLTAKDAPEAAAVAS